MACLSMSETRQRCAALSMPYLAQLDLRRQLFFSAREAAGLFVVCTRFD